MLKKFIIFVVIMSVFILGFNISDFVNHLVSVLFWGGLVLLILLPSKKDKKVEPEEKKEDTKKDEEFVLDYKLPNISDVLDIEKKIDDSEALKETIVMIQNVLSDFNIVGKVIDVYVGPVITRYEVVLKNGSNISKLKKLNSELSLALSAKELKIIAPIPGKDTIGIDVTNRVRDKVSLSSVLAMKRKEMSTMNIPLALGEDYYGEPYLFDLHETPHLLLSGTTGSGISTCINSFINSILITKKPDEVKLILVDPKRVELSKYNNVPHLLCPVISDSNDASVMLKNLVREMERRYKLFYNENVSDIINYNEKTLLQPIPYIVMIIDEFADLMVKAPKDVEESISTIAEKSRAAGIHLIIATQRPSTKIITGDIKVNIPARISFAVPSKVDSRTILDVDGAEKLLGKGDMLFKLANGKSPVFVQGCFINDDEIKRVIDYTSKQQMVQYDDKFLNSSIGSVVYEDDPLFNEIIDFCIESGKVSASLLQRRFRLGYNRAVRIIDILEDKGFIGPANGSKPREVLIKSRKK